MAVDLEPIGWLAFFAAIVAVALIIAGALVADSYIYVSYGYCERPVQTRPASAPGGEFWEKQWVKCEPSSTPEK
jgi:hypothetical protein